MADAPPTSDQRAREEITFDLGDTIFVEAGAGSGKTKALVDRVLALVTGGSVELSQIAAITFTEKAGAELRDRIRQELERLAEAQRDTDVGARCRTALDQLDAAAIGTLHSFAQRLLLEHPLEAGLPPRVEVLDEVSSKVAFEQRWSVFFDELLADRTLQRTLLLFFTSGVRPEALRTLAQVFDDNWDLVEERVRETAPEPPPVRELFEAAAGELRAVCAEPCRDPGDKLRLKLDKIAQWLTQVAQIPDELDLLDALDAIDREPRNFSVGNIGKRSSFDCDVEGLRLRSRRAVDALFGVRSQVAEACTRRIASTVRRFTLSAASERRRAGQLEFHDLLVLARALLRDRVHGRAVRAVLHDRYRRLLLDEFQDTDPIQIELGVRIAAADPAGEAAGSAPWEEVELVPGRLFVVGDPKQSIYRFRRADMATFLAAARCLGSETGRQVQLTANFRSVPPIIDWVNTTFRSLMAHPADSPEDAPLQARYVALEATRPPPPAGAAVAVLGRAEHPRDAKADELRELEAGEVASAVARALDEGWDVDDGGGGWRPAKLGDITILVPSRTSLSFLEDALDAAGIAFRTESSSLVYASRPVRDLLMVLRAVDDPTNYLHVVSALRTPLLACGDDDLFRFRVERRGRWSYLANQPDTVPADDPVRRGLDYLRSLYELRHWLAPSQLLDRIARDRRALELGFTEGRPRDVWRRLRFVIDQARAWSEATGGNLRQYMSWVGRQAAEGTRLEEAVLPEIDDDAVRIMTVHAAKGLQFPVTIVSGMSTRPGRPWTPVRVAFPPHGEVGYRFGSKVTTTEYEDFKPIDEQMDFQERIRLLYVACTRARDHLVVSLHRAARASAAEQARKTNAELLLEGMGGLLDELPDAAAATEEAPEVSANPPPPPPPFAQWEAERSEALARASRPLTVAATALTEEGTPEPEGEPDPGLQKRPRDLDLPPWLKGRYGTSIGRAVHGVLQTVDLATGAGIDAAVAAQCEAEAVPDEARKVERLVQAALGSPSVREAAASLHWREVYVCTPVGARLVEGYVDLLYRGPRGLVVVDYKTAATTDATVLDRRVDVYRNQGASYALAIAAATGEPVVRMTFLFLTPDGALERHLTDLEAATSAVGEIVAAEREVVTP